MYTVRLHGKSDKDMDTGFNCFLLIGSVCRHEFDDNRVLGWGI